MQSLRHTESRPEPRLRYHGQQHLPGNLSCSDYTMCLASLWAILPFCSVKYKRHSGMGKRKVGSLAYQFTTFEFTEPGTGILLYPGCDLSLGAWIDKEAEDGGGGGGGKTAVLKKGNKIWQKSHIPSQLCSLPFCLSSEESSATCNSFQWARPTGPGKKIFVSHYAVLYCTHWSRQLIAAEKFMSTQWLIKKWSQARSSYSGASIPAVQCCCRAAMVH